MPPDGTEPPKFTREYHMNTQVVLSRYADFLPDENNAHGQSAPCRETQDPPGGRVKQRVADYGQVIHVILDCAPWSCAPLRIRADYLIKRVYYELTIAPQH